MRVHDQKLPPGVAALRGAGRGHVRGAELHWAGHVSVELHSRGVSQCAVAEQVQREYRVGQSAGARVHTQHTNDNVLLRGVRAVNRKPPDHF